MNVYLLVPLVLFSLVWALAFKQVIRGVIFGEMIEYVRRSNPTRLCAQGSEPVPFAMFFAFYSAVTFVVPIALLAMMRAG